MFTESRIRKMKILCIGIVLFFSVMACSTAPFDGDGEMLTGQIKMIQVDCGGWGLQTDDEFYELQKLPDEYKEDGLRVQMAIKHLEDRASCTMVGPIVEVLEVKRVD